jgi:hypothetical protein
MLPVETSQQESLMDDVIDSGLTVEQVKRLRRRYDPDEFNLLVRALAQGRRSDEQVSRLDGARQLLLRMYQRVRQQGALSEDVERAIAIAADISADAWARCRCAHFRYQHHDGYGRCEAVCRCPQMTLPIKPEHEDDLGPRKNGKGKSRSRRAKR